MPMQQSVLSKQYVRVPVIVTVNGQPYNPSADVVQMAFTAPGVKPVSGDWQVALWEIDATRGLYWAACLVGPGGTITLTVGSWDVWIKVFDTPETPSERAGTLVIY